MCQIHVCEILCKLNRCRHQQLLFTGYSSQGGPHIRRINFQCLLTLLSLLFATCKVWISLSFLNSEAGRCSIWFPLRFNTCKWTSVSRPSIFVMQLLDKLSSRSCVNLSSFSIFSIMWLLTLRTLSFFRPSRFSRYYKKSKVCRILIYLKCKLEVPLAKTVFFIPWRTQCSILTPVLHIC